MCFKHRLCPLSPLFARCDPSLIVMMAGCNVICGIDFDKRSIASCAHTFPRAIEIIESVTAIPRAKLMNRLGIEPEELDVLVGGPPAAPLL